ASSSNTKVNVPVAAVDERPVIVDSSTFVSEPAVTTEERTIWEKQVLIPHKLEGQGIFPSAHHL
ncbi:hypothetical protein A2U01_0079314, partial [Trifolium medium]|nr:hypothetical protein [Trifolium medium]